VNFDGKIRTTEFALHAGNASFGLCGLDHKEVHLQYIGRAEGYADIAAFAVLFNDFNFTLWTTHYRLSPLFLVPSLRLINGGILAQMANMYQRFMAEKFNYSDIKNPCLKLVEFQLYRCSGQSGFLVWLKVKKGNVAIALYGHDIKI